MQDWESYFNHVFDHSQFLSWLEKQQIGGQQVPSQQLLGEGAFFKAYRVPFMQGDLCIKVCHPQVLHEPNITWITRNKQLLESLPLSLWPPMKFHTDKHSCAYATLLGQEHPMDKAFLDQCSTTLRHDLAQLNLGIHDHPQILFWNQRPFLSDLSDVGPLATPPS